MQLKKLRDWFIEGKIYYNRTQGYLSIFNFLMIVLIFLNTTAWDYAFVQQIFQSRKIFMAFGVIFVLVLTGLIGYIDTRLKLWRTESEKNLAPERNPQFVPIAFQCAKMINELKKDGKDTKETEASLNEIFARCKLSKEFEFFKESTK
jgi:hypothetical protein